MALEWIKSGYKWRRIMFPRRRDQLWRHPQNAAKASAWHDIDIEIVCLPIFIYRNILSYMCNVFAAVTNC